MTQAMRRGIITYPLAEARRYPSGKVPAAHQEEALRRLRRWFTQPAAPRGGILVLPTGGGKTFTATRFLTEGPLSRGHKVVWLAHTHHLLDQAFAGFGRDAEGRYEVGHIGGDRDRLTLRTVSGTLGHGKVAEIRASDDVVIITLQTLARALTAGAHQGLADFLAQARSTGLTVVFDECHHAPAPSFRRLIEGLRERVPDTVVLGLTATPTYTDQRRQGYLQKLFPQTILHQVGTQELMLAGILARPIVEEPVTHIQPEFSEADYRTWRGSYRDLPERVIAHLARHRERNAMIADTYAQNREKYGQTIIFADRWYQCTALVELLRERGVRAAAIFTHQEADPGSVEARNARSATGNELALHQFKRGELDVLVNIRMLTEGTDVPNVKTVFLTRQTTSRILITQMIGRALRGPRFGGTEEAYIVAFIDDWKQHINWARWDDLLGLPVGDGGGTAARERLPVELVSAGLVAHLARELDAGQLAAIPFLTLLPVGWYAVSYDAAVLPQEGADDGDDIETVRQLIPVYSPDQGAYRRLVAELDQVRLDDFGDVELSEAARQNIRGWVSHFFTAGERLTQLHDDVLSVVRHRARHGTWPTFTPFEARQEHDLDALAQRLAFEQQLPRRQEDQALRAEFGSTERLWPNLYRSYDQFKRQYDASVNRLLHLEHHPEAAPELGTIEETFTPDEVPEAVKKAVKRRDRKCLCCGRTSFLQVDHVRSRYHGGDHSEDNLQLLCSVCNALKGTRNINFRDEVTSLTSAEEVRASADWIFRRTGSRASDGPMILLERMTNMAYQCQACAEIRRLPASAARPYACYEVRVKAGNDPAWVQPILDQALALWKREVPDFGRLYGGMVLAVAP